LRDIPPIAELGIVDKIDLVVGIHDQQANKKKKTKGKEGDENDIIIMSRDGARWLRASNPYCLLLPTCSPLSARLRKKYVSPQSVMKGFLAIILSAPRALASFIMLMGVLVLLLGVRDSGMIMVMYNMLRKVMVAATYRGNFRPFLEARIPPMGKPNKKAPPAAKPWRGEGRGMSLFIVTKR